MLKTLTSYGAMNHQGLAAVIVFMYGAASLLSLMRHGERSHCYHLTLRATSLLREAARSSLRADDRAADAIDRFAEATRACSFVNAVEKIMTPEEVSRYGGISIDALRDYTEKQVDKNYDLMRSMRPAPSLRHARY